MNKFINDLKMYEDFISQYSKINSHAYLILNEDSYMARMIALMFSCSVIKDKGDKTFDESMIQRASNGNLIDIKIVPSRNKNIVVDDIKEVISGCNIKPLEYNKKSYILLDIDKATIQAQNKLLKTLEETPENVIFILTATNEKKIIPTIISRINLLRAPKISKSNMISIIKKHYKDNDNFNNAIALSKGDFGRALNFLNSKTFFTVQKECIEILLEFNGSNQLIKYYNILMKYNNFIEEVFDSIIHIFIDIIYYKSEKDILLKNHESKIKILSEKYNNHACIKIINRVNKLKIKLESNISITSVINELLISILEEKYKWS